MAVPSSFRRLDALRRHVFGRKGQRPRGTSRSLRRQGIVFGDIHLADVRAWYELRVRAAGLVHVEPLWAEEPRDLLGEFVASGGRAVVTCCDTAKLEESWLGRIIDQRFVRDIANVPIDPCGENGEYHSFVFASPLFARAVPYAVGERRSDGRFAQLDILRA